MKKIIDIISKAIAIISILFILWVLFSWIEVISKNNTENPTYSKTNVFVLMTENLSK